MEFAFVENGVCVNAIIADNEAFAHSLGAVPLPEGFGIGDCYDGTNWKKQPAPEPGPEPEPEPPTLEERVAALESGLLAVLEV